ncbi:YqaJ viral recombinase family protein, partial [Streptomyces albidoflavus]|uniref:YqaJ viral recombinase family nuclease n=1 Tax=Streptomyces albidoflavus TaxID=1886 RepID=UPI0033247BE7
MSARLILGPEAPREAWLAARLPGITASEIAAVLGISPFESPFSLHWRKRGELGETPDNDAMSLGRHLEPWIADKFEATHPELTLELAGLYASTDRPWQMATPDRLIFADQPGAGAQDYLAGRLVGRGPDSLWEGKTSATYDGWGDDGTDQVPAYYRAQVLWQADVFDLPYVDLTCLFLHTKQVRHYRIERDAADIAFMRARALEFLRQVDRRAVPPIDGHKATTAALKELHPKLEDRDQEVSLTLKHAYELACATAKAAEEQKDLLTNELRAVMGNARYAVHYGDRVA